MDKLLNEKLVIVGADVRSPEEAIRLISSRLLECGYVREGYAEMVLAREKIFPTGLPGKVMSIAIPHTDPTLVNRAAVGVLVPKHPVPFAMMGEPQVSLDVSLIFPLVIKDSAQQINLLKEMMNVIQDSERLIRIRDCGDPNEIVELLASLELVR